MAIDNYDYKLRIYLLRKNLVKKRLRKRNNDFVVRACYFGGDYSFDAAGMCIGSDAGYIRGIRRREIITECDVQEIKADNLEYTPEGITQFLNENPVTDEEFASALLSAAGKFYNRRTGQQ